MKELKTNADGTLSFDGDAAELLASLRAEAQKIFFDALKRHIVARVDKPDLTVRLKYGHVTPNNLWKMNFHLSNYSYVGTRVKISPIF